MSRSLFCLALLLAPCLALADDEKPEAKLSADEKALLELLNKEREKEKLPKLTVNERLMKAARAHTENMAKQEKMSHELDGKNVGERVTDAGYDWGAVAENVAKAGAESGDPPAPPAAEIHKGWMESKGHRANILGEKYKEVGLGMVKSKKGTYFYTQVFAAPRR
ncbi:MAG: CAP domain-containing protein [Gemmataceae bacterium]